MDTTRLNPPVKLGHGFNRARKIITRSKNSTFKNFTRSFKHKRQWLEKRMNK